MYHSLHFLFCVDTIRVDWMSPSTHTERVRSMLDARVLLRTEKTGFELARIMCVWSAQNYTHKNVRPSTKGFVNTLRSAARLNPDRPDPENNTFHRLALPRVDSTKTASAWAGSERAQGGKRPWKCFPHCAISTTWRGFSRLDLINPFHPSMTSEVTTFSRFATPVMAGRQSQRPFHGQTPSLGK
jgi:hypothetical protein